MLKSGKQVAIWTALCILFGIILPFVFVVILYKKKLINDLHVPRREDRLKPLIVSNLSYLFGFFVFYIFKAPVFLKAIFLHLF